MAAIPAVLLSYGLSSLIKSVQAFSIVVTTTTNTATITSVDTTRACIFYGGQLTTDSSAAGASFDLSHGDVVLTNGTTVTANKNTSGTYTVTIPGFVVEWASGVTNSVQRGTITLTAAATNTATISSVTTGNAFVNYLGFTTTYASSAMTNTWTRLNLTNATTVTATRGGTANNVTISYEVVEYASGILKSSTQETTTTMTGTSSASTSITAVTTNNAIAMWGGYSGTFSNNDASKRPVMQALGSTSVPIARTSTTENTTVTATVVEFNTQHMKTAVQSIVSVMTATNTTLDNTITSVNTSNAAIAYQGGDTLDVVSTRNDQTQCTLTLTSATNVRQTKSLASASGQSFAYGRVVNFA